MNRNMCSIAIKIEDKTISAPVTFGSHKDYVINYLPYLYEYSLIQLSNPGDNSKYSYFWNNKSEASLLEIATNLIIDTVLMDINVTREQKLPRAKDIKPDLKSNNQCVIIMKFDNEEVRIPLIFSYPEEDLKNLYPDLISIVNKLIDKPSYKFANHYRMGICNGVSTSLLDAEKRDIVEKRLKKQSKYWNDISSCLLSLIVSFAVDIRFKGIDYVADLFNPEIKE